MSRTVKVVRTYVGRFRDEAWNARGPMRPVGRLLVVALVLSVLYAVASLVFVSSFVDFQLRRAGYETSADVPPFTREAFLVVDVVRIVLVVAIFANYAHLVRWLGSSDRRKYRNLLLFSIFGVALYSYLLVTAYPAWAHVLQGLQLIVVAAIAVLLVRRSVRDRYV